MAATKKNAVEYANAICVFLKNGNFTLTNSDTKTAWATTQTIINGLGIPVTSRDTLLKFCDRLSISAVLAKGKSGGSSGYAYRLLVDSWDEADPFKSQQGALPNSENAPIPSIPGSDSDEDDEDDEYPELPVPSFKPQSHGSASNQGAVDTIARAAANTAKAEVARALELILKVTKANDELVRINKTLEEKIDDLKAAADAKPRTIIVKRYETKEKELPGEYCLPKEFDTIKQLAEMRKNILLVGPAGCGKTTTAKILSDVMGLRFGSIGCSGSTTESHFFGKGTPNIQKGTTDFHGTEFLECFEKGGVYVIDEIDAMDSNVLLSLNTALANGYCSVPNRVKNPRAEMHKDFICIATANTFGKGANRVYSGRNQLDEASLSRFRIGMIETYYDKEIERALCPDQDLLDLLWAIRSDIEKAGLRRVMDTRYVKDAYAMRAKCDWTFERITKTYVQGWTADEIAKLTCLKAKQEVTAAKK